MVLFRVYALYARARQVTMSANVIAKDKPRRQTRPTLPDFGLAPRALRFAKLYAEYPTLGVSACARQAGYSDKGRGAHVRGCELLRDPRVTRAIVHFNGLALSKACSTAAIDLQIIAAERIRKWPLWDRVVFDRLSATLMRVDKHLRHLNHIYSSTSPMSA